MPIRALAALLLGIGLAAPATALGEIFVLKSEGRVRGEIVNADESPRKNYVVKTPSGGQVVLEADQVKQVLPQSASEIEYDRIRPGYPDTVEGQWELAEWCREHRLSKQRQTHLERVIALDADHVKARHALGYVNWHGKWTTEEEIKRKAGYVRYNKEWRLPQEVQLMEEHRKEEAAQGDWRKKLARLRKALDADKGEAARDEILAIRDPYAVKTLAQSLTSESNQRVRLLYVDALGKIGTPPALDALAVRAVVDEDEEIRLAALEKLAAAHYKPALASFVQLLKSKDNGVINRAAEALARMKDPRAVGPLIDALVTTHAFKVVKGQPGQMSSTFGSGPGVGGGSFSFGGGGVELVKRQLNNQEVLNALVLLTGGVNFDYDVKAWKAWYAMQKKRVKLDARRD